MPDYESMTGEELWVAVAERVMGWSYVGSENDNDPDGSDEPSHYSHVFVDDCPPGMKIFRGPRECSHPWQPGTDPAACMEALEKLRENGWVISWSADNAQHEVGVRHPSKEIHEVAIGETFTRAACIAMLKATERGE